MYPRISDLINDLLGTHLRLPIQSFGFMVALAFLAAFFFLERELRRKEAEGIFSRRKITVKKGNPVQPADVALAFLLWGVLGFKLGYMAEDYDAFYANPQQALLSFEGSWPIGLLAALGGGGWRFWEYWRNRHIKESNVTVEYGIQDELGTLITIAFVAGLLGAKLFHNFENWDQFMDNPVKALLSFDGLTFYGGLICAAVLIAWRLSRKGFPVLPFADATAPVLMLGYGIGRIGCQLAGDGDWGIVNTAPKPGWLSWAPDWVWAFDYPHNVLKEGIPIEGCTMDGGYCFRLPETVFPTPFYETLMALFLFAVLWALRKRLPYWGQLTGIYLVFNGLERFLIEKIRVNNPGRIFGIEATQAEVISFLLIVLGIALFALATFRWKKQAAAPASVSSPAS
jgi:prolipoprotein diacylglyceryltransferase